MRLKQLRLAGFKSFVDPTSFEVPSQLVGVVGPNGCGKSNIMDAVRWVLGESKASELRGESMQDVIFSGSSERKPASRAMVELVFDNALGRIGGTWGSFSELSVRRVLTRDGQSSYYINGQSVRRKDVHDIFLGTGLGPRAYAIIGQGMISRIIEARPEDLRIFLEEAAGVSRYKERRRETENRLGDTRENLTRVDDILRELGAQIERLERQAEVAQQFRQLEAERELRQHTLWLLRRDEALGEQQRQARLQAEAENELQERIARQRALEAQLEEQRAAHYAGGDEVHAAQGRFYDANGEVTRLESDIRRVLDSQGQLGERIKSLDLQIERTRQERDRARQDLDATQSQGDLLVEHAERQARQVVELSESAGELELGLREARAALDDARSAAVQTRQAIELSATRRRAAEQAFDQATRRGERLREESAGVVAPDALELEDVRERLMAAEEADRALADRLEETDARWREADAQRAPSQAALRSAEAKLAQIEARIQALRQIQERAQSQERVGPWLGKHGLSSLGRLWQKLRIEEGWETALESVLRERVEALEVGHLEHVSALSADTPPGKVSFFSPRATGPVSAPAIPGFRSLLEVVRSTDASLHLLLGDWLSGWFVAESVDQAMADRERLPPGGRFVTPEGHAVGRHSLQMYARDSEREGVLARQHELDHLGREVRAQHLMVDEARNAARRAESAAAELLAALGSAREESVRQGRALSTLRLESQRLEQQADRARQQRDRIEGELAEVMAALDDAQAVIDAEIAAFDEYDVLLAERQQRAEDLSLAFEDRQSRLAAHREALRSAEREAQESAFSIRETEGRRERLAASIEQSARLEQQSLSERALCEERLGELSDAAARLALDAALAARLEAEQALSAARQRLEELTGALRSGEEARLRLEREQEPLRSRVIELQLKEQAARLNAEQFEQQLREAQVDEAAVRASFDEAPRTSWLQGEVTRLANAIAALGAVNLAALDELSTARERKGFLDEQARDLNEAITTLEDAIRKIDRETREVLKQTFDTVNAGFGKLFPELFGGGEARLILTGDEILDSGVQVMAQPPGKRNSSIHLLSGGEKALTAIALVFAMFQLNPAPFCLLDEVDAPLDDANTERYTDMVRRMSENTQFLFITHNKIAMELAQQLVGVTMQERGVSRIVAVDLDAAARMVEVA